MIKIFPAIDLHNGQAVRLRQGDYNQVEVFFKNPVEVLDFFNKNNSKNLHIVDLDGAKDGNTKNYEVIKELVEKSDFFVQVGGGIRDEERIKKYIELGVNRVILYRKLSKVVNSDIIASGGITFLDEIKELNKNHIYGAIVGKAIYSGNLDLKEVLEISK